MPMTHLKDDQSYSFLIELIGGDVHDSIKRD
jgi:hypothetical protein